MICLHPEGAIAQITELLLPFGTRKLALETKALNALKNVQPLTTMLREQKAIAAIVKTTKKVTSETKKLSHPIKQIFKKAGEEVKLLEGVGRETANNKKICHKWGKFFKYRHGEEMSAIEHIMHRHSFNSGFSNVSKFSKGTAVKMIKKYVDEALQHGIPIFKNNSYQLCYDLKKIIGIGSNGEIASKIMIHIKNGWIRTVFPTN